MSRLLVLLLLCSFLVIVNSLEWTAWKEKYNKSYSMKEDAIRMQIYKENLQTASLLQKKNPDALYGETQFSDLTPEEFKQLHLTTKPSVGTSKHNLKVPPLIQTAKPLPSEFDWRSRGVITPVENEGQCGAVWAFVATETLESVCAIAGYPLVTLSTQQVVSCDTVDFGCDGGYPTNAYNYLIQAGGIQSNESYPYNSESGTTGSCHYNKNLASPCHMFKWEYVMQGSNETQMQWFIYLNSPIIALVSANSWQYYQSGVITKSADCGTTIDFCVQLVGWTVVGGIPSWIVRNTWGETWGVNGYLFIEIGYNVCGIATQQGVIAPCVHSPAGKVVC